MTKITINDAVEQYKSYNNEERSPKLIAHSLNMLENRWQTVFDNLASDLAPKFARQVERTITAQIRRTLEAGNIPTFPFVMTLEMQNILDLTIEENVNLIKSIPQKYFTQVKSIVYEGIARGGDLHYMTNELVKQTGITQRRAALIARDQNNKATTQMATARYKSVGIEEGVWSHSGGGSKPRPKHIAANGKRFKLSKGLPIGDKGQNVLPGQEINCLPGNSLIQSGNGCRKIFRRFYVGELATIVTNDGVTIEATPNHPILTRRGWMPIKLINQGDYIIRTIDQTFNTAKANINNMPITFEKCFSTLAEISGINCYCASAEFQFHGDASNGEISIVDIDSFLPNEIDAITAKQICELIFTETNYTGNTGSFSINGALYSTLSIIFGAPEFIIRGFCALFSLLKSKSTSANATRFALCSALDTLIDQNTIDNRTANVKVFRDSLLAFPIEIPLHDFIMRQSIAVIARASLLWHNEIESAEALCDSFSINTQFFGDTTKRLGFKSQSVRVTDICFRQFEGHVYNLESFKNWYVSQNTVYHNCRCTFRPLSRFNTDRGRD